MDSAWGSVAFCENLHRKIWLVALWLWLCLLPASVSTSVWSACHVSGLLYWVCCLCWVWNVQPRRPEQSSDKICRESADPVSKWELWQRVCSLLCWMYLCCSEEQDQMGVAWMHWFLVGSSWIIMGLFSVFFNTTWIPGIAEAGILSGLSGCWWPSSSVEVGLLVCGDANCCWMALWCHWKQHQQPESGSCSAQPEGGLDWVSWLGDGVM